MRRKWTQVSLRSLSLLVTFFAIALGLATAYLRPYYCEQTLFAELQQGEGFSAKTEVVGPIWLRQLIGGNKYAQRVVWVEIGDGFEDDNLAKLSQFRHLRTLMITRSKREDGVRYFAPMGGPYLEDFQINDSSLARLAGIKSLEDLMLADCQVTDEGLAILRHFPNLQSLDINGNRVTNEGLTSLSLLPNLRKLSIASKLIDDNGLASLGKLTQLESLRIRANVSDGGMAPLSSLKSLQSLRCVHLNHMTRHWIAGLSKPTQVDFVGTPLNDVREYLGDLLNCPIQFDDLELAAKGIDPAHVVISLNRQCVPLRECLNDVLSPHGLDYVVRDEVFIVTTQDAAARSRVGITELQKKLPDLKDVEVSW